MRIHFQVAALFAATLVFALALGLYLLTLAPTITWAHQGTDGGDLITAAATLGIAHPPGYPTYVLLGHLFAQIPLGDVAYRLNLMSAVCMALAAGLTTLGIVRANSSAAPGTRASAVIGGLAFAAAPMVWGQATIAEVHALNALFVSALVCLLAPSVFGGEPPSTRILATAMLVWGLGLGNLVTLVALAPITLSVWWRRRRVRSLIDRGSAVVAFVLGLSVYAFIPIRAAQQPAVNWGNATTWPNFVAQVTAEMYRGYVFGLPLDRYPARLMAFAQLLIAQFGPVGTLIGAIGVGRALAGPGRRPVALSATLYSIFALSYNTNDSDLYLIPVWLFGAWAIARGVVALSVWATERGGRRVWIGVATLTVALGPGWIIAGQFAAMDLREDRSVENFADAVLSSAPANAILVASRDAHTFTLWYYRVVAGRRQDVAIVDSWLAGYPWYEQVVSDQDHALRMPAYDLKPAWIAHLAADNSTRPVCSIDPLTQAMTCRTP